MVRDGHQAYSRVLYANYKDSLLKVGGLPSPIKGFPIKARSLMEELAYF